MTQAYEKKKNGDVISPRCLRVFLGHIGTVKFVAFTPNGKNAISGGDDYTLRVWEIDTGVCIKIFKFNPSWGDERNSFALSSDATFALVGCLYSPSELLEIETGRCLKVFENCGYPVSVALSSDVRYAVSGNIESIGLWEVTTGKCLRDFKLKPDVYVQSTAFSSDPRFALFAFAGKDKAMQLWDVETGTPIRSFEGHTDHVNSVAISQDGRYAVSGSDDHSLRLWEVETGRCIKVLEGHTHCVNVVALSLDGKYILSGSVDNTIRVWDVETGKCISVINGHDGHVESVAFSSDGRYILSGGSDETIKLWRI